jgi:hypothetical protein
MPELGGDDHLVAAARDRLADELLAAGVDVGGVDHGDAEFDGPADQGVGGSVGDLVRALPVGAAEAHRPVADDTDGQAAGPEYALFNGHEEPPEPTSVNAADH